MLDVPHFGVYTERMANEEKHNSCYMCRHFDRLYIKGHKQYNATKYGFCRVHCKNVQIHETCEKFIKKPYIKKSNKSIQSCLNDLLIEISEIRKVLDEERGGEEM